MLCRRKHRCHAIQTADQQTAQLWYHGGRTWCYTGKNRRQLAAAI